MMLAMDEDLELIRQSGGEHYLKRAAWERVVSAWRQSGLRPGEFCRRHGLSGKRFYQWRKRLQPPMPGSPPQRGLIEVTCTADRADGAIAGVVQIELASATLRLPYERSTTQLTMILRSLREATC